MIGNSDEKKKKLLILLLRIRYYPGRKEFTFTWKEYTLNRCL